MIKMKVIKRKFVVQWLWNWQKPWFMYHKFNVEIIRGYHWVTPIWIFSYLVLCEPVWKEE